MGSNSQARRVVIRPDGRAETAEFSVPSPGAGQVLVRAEYTAVSAGTELGSQEQTREGDYYPGYSSVGVVAECGAGVTDIQPGDRVLSGGGHASHFVSSVSSPYFAPVPDGASSRDAAFGVIGMVAMHGARKAAVQIGERVLVTGAGMVGQLVAQLIPGDAAESLTVVDLSADRLARAAALGATHTICPVGGAFADAHAAETGGPVDVAVEATGFPDLLAPIVDALRVGGRCVLLGSIWHRKVTLDLMPLHEKEITLQGCHQPKCPDEPHAYYPYSKTYNSRAFLARLADGRVRVAPLITHVLSPDDAGEAYRLLRDERDAALGVLFDFTDG